MAILSKLSVRQKLIGITMITVLGVTVFLASMVVFNEAVERRQSVYQKRVEQLAIVAEIIASRSTAAIVFDDKVTATENLNSLRALRSDASLVLAGIFDPKGVLFAEYRPVGQQHRLSEQVVARGCEEGEQSTMEPLLRVCSPIRLDENGIGEVRLIYDMADDLKLFKNKLLEYLFGVLVVVVAALGLALLLSSWLQRIISEPILELREAMRQVSSSKDYSIRVSPVGQDELGALVDGFNEMLKQIQSRDTELALNSEQLQEQVTARTQELQEANQQRMLWLENLAHILRHELKSATVGVRSSLDLIERRAKDESLDRYIDRARISMNYMAKLLDSVGTASTLESSFEQDEKQRLDLAQLVERQVEVCRASYSGVDIACRCQPGIEVLASESRLMQLLDKLIANAVDYHVDGSTIDLATEGHGQDVVLSVSNQGSPLPENKERIFELFVSMRDAEHRQSENFGLGLYIVKLIVKSHGGRIEAENLPDCSGARISVILPRIINGEVALAPSPNNVSPSLSN